MRGRRETRHLREASASISENEINDASTQAICASTDSTTGSPPHNSNALLPHTMTRSLHLIVCLMLAIVSGRLLDCVGVGAFTLQLQGGSFDSIEMRRRAKVEPSRRQIFDGSFRNNNNGNQHVNKDANIILWATVQNEEEEASTTSNSSSIKARTGATDKPEKVGNYYNADDTQEENGNTSTTANTVKTKSKRKLSSYRLMQDLKELAAPSSSGMTHAAACKSAANVLDRAHNQFFAKNNTACKPTAAMYTAAINVYGKHGQPEQAEEALFFLWNLYNSTTEDEFDPDKALTGDPDMRPNVKTYTAVLDAWGRSSPSKHPNGLERCETVLKEMMANHELNPDLFPQPNSITFDAVLNAFARQSQPFRHNKKIPERAEALLQQMEDLKLQQYGDVCPTTQSFTSVITSWAHSKRPEASERAKYILDRMMELSKTQPSVAPNTYTFNTVLDSFANNSPKDQNAAKDAAKLLAVMEQISRMRGSTTHNADNNKNHNHSVQPDTITYNTVLKAYAKSKARNAATKAELLLEKMRHEYEVNGNVLVKPNDVSFNSVIAAYAHHSRSLDITSVQSSQKILLQMIDLSKNNNNENKYTHLQPSVVSFTTVMDAWAKSKVPQKANNTWLMLKHLKELYRSTGNPALRPNIISYNTLLNACAFSADFDTEERKKALLIAVGAFNELRKQLEDDDDEGVEQDADESSSTSAEAPRQHPSPIILKIKPDEITYGMMLKVCSNLMPRDSKQRDVMARKLFQQSCEEGLVGSLVLSELKRAVPQRRTLSGIVGKGDHDRSVVLFPDGSVNAKKLPRAWSRNVKNDNRRNNVNTAKGGRKGPQSKQQKRVPPPPKSRQVSRYARTGPAGGESTSIGMDFV
jgi:hypothetical protein